jgi:cytochrome c oxidase assembly protein subunit 15
MVVAFVLACLVIWAINAERLRKVPIQVRGLRPLRWVALLAFGLALVQVALGTQLRELVDVTSQNLSAPDRSTWLDRSSTSFLVHRSFSWLAGISVVLLAVLLFRQLAPVHKRWGTQALVLLQLVVGEILVGVTLAYANMPALGQPVHLLLAAGLCGWLFFVVLVTHLHCKPMPSSRTEPPTPVV